MSDPPVHATEMQTLEELRRRAASRLTGPAATKGATARVADALAVLHDLAASPNTASDALTLLHELQVHQIEVDLQAQELRESRAELESALRRQIELYDHLPVGCFTIDPQRGLYELNQTGADMLGIGRDAAYGLPLEAFLCADSALRFRAAMSGPEAGTPRPPCVLTLCPKDGPQRQVIARFAADPAAQRYLVSLTPAGKELALSPEGHQADGAAPQEPRPAPGA